MNNLQAVERNEAYQIMSQVAEKEIEIHAKIKDKEQIYKTKLQNNNVRRYFYILNKGIPFTANNEVTFKIIYLNKLFFLKVNVKQISQKYYFDRLTDFFELIRRKKKRLNVPVQWAQSAQIHSHKAALDLKSTAVVLDISKAGIRLHVQADLPRYEIGEQVNLYFKIYRRAEILVKSRVVHVKALTAGGAQLGLEFSDNSILIANKIQNVCDDLAFYYAAQI